MKRPTAIVLSLLIVMMIVGVTVRMTGIGGPDAVVVVHWSNGHLRRDGLLPDMSEQFNKAVYRTASGRPISVRIVRHGSAEQAADLLSRVTLGVPLDRDKPDPTIVTPSADHWLVPVNHAAGRTVVDLQTSQSIARTLVGIVTYRDMAECLGWPHKSIGYADIIELRNDPMGWQRYPCAKAEWGQRPLVAYTDPTTSSTGRSVLITLYAIAAGKPTDQLTAEDIHDPAVVAYVKRFQGLVDHYMIGTIPLNTKIYQGPRFGHFFLMPEDNLIHLYEGTERALINGMRVKPPPISRPMVMIYPTEGSTVHSHVAGFVQADWVSEEQTEGGRKWLEFLHEDEQQRKFMAAGFRPATNLALTDPISGRFGLDPSKPEVTINPGLIGPAVAEEISKTWGDVKRAGIVTFVVDNSGSMSGRKLEQVRDGLIRTLDAMAKRNQVGLLTFSEATKIRSPIAALTQNRFQIADAARDMTANGQTALYDAVAEGIRLTDAAEGEAEAIRGVVVLTDGLANHGSTRLDDLVRMMSRDEVAIREFSGFQKGGTARDVHGRVVARADVVGTGLALATRHPVQVFFIGIGNDADMEIGRVLAEATGAEFQGVTEADLANVLAEFGKYF